MSITSSRVRVAVASCTSTAALAAAISLALVGVVVPTQSAHAQSAACAAAWNASAVYTGGNTASENGTNYTANWWTQGNDPATNSGPSGSGQPWTSTGACSGGGTTPPPVDPPPPTNPPPAAGTLLFSPYKDVTINLNWNTNLMQTAASGTVLPLVGSGSFYSTVQPNLGAVTLAFASGECGSENWGGLPAASFAGANIPALNNAGLNYIVSTGGQAGLFTCSTTAGMAKFLSTYNTSHMVGIDFDIEGGQTPAQLTSLVSMVAYAQTLYPNLRYSFTLATLAASDGSYGGLNSTGDAVIKAIKAKGLTNYVINLMVMDYGSGASSSICVVANGQCDMGQSAIQAAKNLQHTYGIPLTQIELTPMIGVNDASSEIFTPANVDTMTAYAVANKLAGIHYWSLDRDTPCSSNQTTASPTCNSVSGSTPVQYTKRFLHDLGR
ncbi:carbohydrate binding protein [Luteibacter rhizovicinus]|uniref:Carbohydrate binding protein n=1 Tax=Luteibacter rhizovicinus TaxID=242606 RepID=A0A4R3YQW9_9GAMM|nr:carbohydrate-binding protein [Luteibacter rhizovicinus]TCV94820.1 carbohydrate binding protein [Luteibacter rhizovicinus]